jgi:hypothetical protein
MRQSDPGFAPGAFRVLALRQGQHVDRGLGAFGLGQHPDKTFIGRTRKGSAFPGYHFGPEGLTVAKATVRKFVQRAARLYEQEPGEPGGSARLGRYGRRWTQ